MSYIEQLLAQNEQIVMIAHQSWVVLLRDALVNLLIALLVIGVTMVAMGTQQPYAFLVALLLLVPAGNFVWSFMRWANREYIVTNRRVIQVNGTINKNVIDSSLEKVNDVRLTQSIVGRFLNYGDVEILTGSELGMNLFQRIDAPIKFKTAMMNEKEKLGFNEVPAAGEPTAPPKPADVPSLIASLNALKQAGLITDEEFQKKKAELLARM